MTTTNAMIINANVLTNPTVWFSVFEIVYAAMMDMDIKIPSTGSSQKACNTVTASIFPSIDSFKINARTN